MRAVDDRTLVVQLEEPAAYFLRLASTWTLYPLPRWAIERHGDRWTEAGNIVTNGPFKLETWRHDQELVLVRDDAYWGTEADAAAGGVQDLPGRGGRPDGRRPTRPASWT